MKSSFHDYYPLDIFLTSSWWPHHGDIIHGDLGAKNSWKLSKYWPKLANVYKQSSNFSSNYQKFQLIFPKYLQTKCQITPKIPCNLSNIYTLNQNIGKFGAFLEAPPSYKREPIWPIPQSRSKTETDNNSQLLKLW